MDSPKYINMGGVNLLPLSYKAQYIKQNKIMRQKALLLEIRRHDLNPNAFTFWVTLEKSLTCLGLFSTSVT
jgi:hypothetical protein